MRQRTITKQKLRISIPIMQFESMQHAECSMQSKHGVFSLESIFKCVKNRLSYDNNKIVVVVVGKQALWYVILQFMTSLTISSMVVVAAIELK